MADQDLIPLLLQLLAEEKQVETAIAVELQPESDWNGQWQYCSVKEMLNLPFTQRYDLAIVNLFTQQFSEHDSDIDQTLVRLRDLFARKILVLADIKFEKQLRALGFNQLSESTDVSNNEQLFIWQFNILNYKHVPDWFNSKFWANPDNWNKYRW